MAQHKETQWISKRIAETAESACTKSLSLLKVKKGADLEGTVPKVRENLKIIRAALRLVRDANKSYKKQNAFYRDGAKKILPMQKAIAMVKAIDLINEQYSERLYKNAFTELRNHLEKQKEEEIDSAINGEHIFRNMHQDLEDKCGTLKEQLSKPIAFDTIESGLKRVYQRGRKAKKKLSDSQTNESFHELQKRVNYLKVQLEIIKPIWPNMMDVWKAELKKLSDLLVTSEGLYQLSEFLKTKSGSNATEDGSYLMKTLIEGHREQVQQHAMLLAQKIYCLKPKQFIGLIQAAWDSHAMERTQQVMPSEKLGLSQ